VGLINMDKVDTLPIAIVSPSKITTPLIGLVSSDMVGIINSDGSTAPIVAFLKPDYFDSPVIEITSHEAFDENLLSIRFDSKWESQPENAPQLVFDTLSFIKDPILSSCEPTGTSDNSVTVVDFDDPVYFTGVEFADPMNLDIEFLDASAFADGSAVLTFGTSGGGGNGGLPPGEYTAKVDTGISEPVVYDCGLNSAEPDNLYCYGPAIAEDTPIVADISYTSADFVLAEGVKGVLADATASNLSFDFSNLNKAAETLGLGEVDNPYEAWGVIGCCIQNISPEGLPEGCDAAVGDLFPSTSSNGNDDPMAAIISNAYENIENAENEADTTNSEQAWQALMDQCNAPQGWTGSPGSLNPTAQQAIFDSANACAAALGVPADEINNLAEARYFFDMIWSMDPRREPNDGPGGFMGVMTDLLSGIADTFDAIGDLLIGTWPEDFGILGDIWDNTFGTFASTTLFLFCSATVSVHSDDIAYDVNACKEGVEEFTGSPVAFGVYDDEFAAIMEEREDGTEPEPFPPQACLDYIDYAKEHTYFAAASSNFIGSEYNYLGTPMAYCAEAMGFGYTPAEIKPYMDTNYMYDKIIAAYGYAGNPAMPDPCRMVVQWCDSDQYASIGNTGQAVAEGSYQGAFANLNGCNDPQSYAEAAAWTGNEEAPDCSGFEQAEATIDIFDGLLGIDTKKDLYCYQVTAFENSPLGDVAACAERLGYSGSPMYSAGEYLDFLAWIGTMDSLDNEQEWSDECWTAIDFAKRFGFVEQSIDTAASSCSQGGPQNLNTSPVEFTMPAVIVPVYDSGGRGKKGGNGGNGGGSCQPDGTFCPLGGGIWGVIQNCVCEVVN